MRLGRIFGAFVLAGGCVIGSAAMAADWQIATVSGKAFRLDGATWVRVAANEPIALGTLVRTLGSGTLTLTREGVTVTLGANSQVQIAERMDGRFTDVFQTAGSAAVEVDPARHIHLAVETPYMAAVVKGTVFTVATFEGYSETSVERGRVAVVDVTNGTEADVTAGQTAVSGPAQPLSLTGPGKLAAPRAFGGRIMSRAPDGTLSEMSGAGHSANGNAGGKGKSAVGADNASDTGKAARGTSNAGGKSANGNATSNNAGGNGKGNSGSNNGNGNGNSGSNNANSNSSSNNAGGNSSSNSGSNNAGGNSNGAGNSGSSNAGGKSK